MSIKTLLFIAGWTLLPISELRGGIPIAHENGMGTLPAYLFCVIINMLIAPIVFLFLNSLHKLLYKISWYKKIFDKLALRSREKISSKLDKYGYLGLMIFVGIPLPVTGAYTGALGAWILGLKPVKSCIFIGIGVAIAGIIITLVWVFGIGFLIPLFTKTVNA